MIFILGEYNIFGLPDGFTTTLVSLVSIDDRSEKAVDCSEIFGMMLKVGNAARIEAENFRWCLDRDYFINSFSILIWLRASAALRIMQFFRAVSASFAVKSAIIGK